MRLTTGRVDTSFYQAKNTLTQRTVGPECSGSTSIDVSKMKDGDFAGLALLQKKFGQVGVVSEGGVKSIVMINTNSGKPVEAERVRLTQPVVYLKAECNFTDKIDTASFFYSMDGQSWTKIGSPLNMAYTLPHFMGYRFALFNYATKQAGGYVDFDFFQIADRITP
jgi:beta-xylosidase